MIAEEIAGTASRRGEAAALWWNDGTVSFRSLAVAGRLAAGSFRRLGVSAGDRIAVGLPSSPELVGAVVGALACGAVLVPLNPAYTGDEAGYVVDDSGACIVVTHAAQAEVLRGQRIGCLRHVVSVLDSVGEGESTPRAADDAALIVYTSGTTGRPKGVVLSHGALLANLRTVARAWRWTDGDRLLLTLPCFHLHGLALGILGSLLVGSGIILRPRFVAEEVPRDIERHRATLFFGVPTMFNRLVALPEKLTSECDLSSMRLWVSGSAPLTRATFERFAARFGEAILERFGMSEGGFMISAPLEGPRRPGVVGRPLAGIDIRIVDPETADGGLLCDVPEGEQGELVVRGPNLFAGYWNRPAETARAFVEGYFRSGDLALREADGMIRITGRRSLDVIKTRGFKVSAVEIENQLQMHSAVREVAVVGVPDSDQGERIVAVVTAVPGHDVTSDALRAFAREHLAPHKVPSEVRFVDEIPSTGPGKFNKKLLVARLSSELRLPDARTPE